MKQYNEIIRKARLILERKTAFSFPFLIIARRRSRRDWIGEPCESLSRVGEFAIGALRRMQVQGSATARWTGRGERKFLTSAVQAHNPRIMNRRCAVIAYVYACLYPARSPGFFTYKRLPNDAGWTSASFCSRTSCSASRLCRPRC